MSQAITIDDLRKQITRMKDRIFRLENGRNVAVGAFSAWQSSNHSMPATTLTKVLFQTEEFDVSDWYDTTNSRFTPQLAGIYCFTAQWTSISGMPNGQWQVHIYKNGSSQKVSVISPQNASNDNTLMTNALINLNGITDYVEAYGYNPSGSAITTRNSQNETFFQGHYVGAVN